MFEVETEGKSRYSIVSPTCNQARDIEGWGHPKWGEVWKSKQEVETSLRRTTKPQDKTEWSVKVGRPSGKNGSVEGGGVEGDAPITRSEWRMQDRNRVAHTWNHCLMGNRGGQTK